MFTVIENSTWQCHFPYPCNKLLSVYLYLLPKYLFSIPNVGIYLEIQYWKGNQVKEWLIGRPITNIAAIIKAINFRQRNNNKENSVKTYVSWEIYPLAKEFQMYQDNQRNWKKKTFSQSVSDRMYCRLSSHNALESQSNAFT